MAKREKERIHRERLASLSASGAGLASLSLLAFVPVVTPKYMRPTHLAEVASRLERFREQPFEFVFSVPPRHGKSELVLHWIAWALLRHPDLRIAYVTYNDTQARTQAQKARRIALAAGLEFSNRSESSWRMKGGGVVDWEGVLGTLTGRGYDVIIIDDPVKNRVEAESPTMRERAWAFYQSDCVTRLEPGGSFLCIQTRWNEDDLAGRLTKPNPEEDWDGLENISMPAIANEGVEGEERALWPERWPLEALKKRRQRVGAYAWASLFQGQPRPRGSTVFGQPTFFDELPHSYRVGHGIDLAYTEKTTADLSVVVTMFATRVGISSPLTGEEKVEEWFYVRHVRRKQVRAPEFRDELRAEHAEFGGEMRIYASGTERGAVDFMTEDRFLNGKLVERGLPIEVLPPKGDKFVRSMELAAAWNAGRVLLPSSELVSGDPVEYGWVNDYLDVMRSFSGVRDAHDDDVDASAAAYDVLTDAPVSYPARSNPSARRM